MTKQTTATIRIMDQSGDSALTADIAKIVQEVVKHVMDKTRFAYIAGRAFNFTARNSADKVALDGDIQRLRNMLEDSATPVTIMLTGSLRGGQE